MVLRGGEAKGGGCCRCWCSAHPALLRGHQQNIPIPEALQRGIWGHSEAIQDEQQSTRAELEAALELLYERSNALDLLSWKKPGAVEGCMAACR